MVAERIHLSVSWVCMHNSEQNDGNRERDNFSVFRYPQLLEVQNNVETHSIHRRLTQDSPGLVNRLAAQNYSDNALLSRAAAHSPPYGE